MNAFWVDWTIFLQYVIRHATVIFFSILCIGGVSTSLSHTLIVSLQASFVYCHFYVIYEAESHKTFAQEIHTSVTVRPHTSFTQSS